MINYLKNIKTITCNLTPDLESFIAGGLVALLLCGAFKGALFPFFVVFIIILLVTSFKVERYNKL